MPEPAAGVTRGGGLWPVVELSWDLSEPALLALSYELLVERGFVHFNVDLADGYGTAPPVSEERWKEAMRALANRDGLRVECFVDPYRDDVDWCYFFELTRPDGSRYESGWAFPAVQQRWPTLIEQAERDWGSALERARHGATDAAAVFSPQCALREDRRPGDH